MVLRRQVSKLTSVILISEIAFYSTITVTIPAQQDTSPRQIPELIPVFLEIGCE
jgi:hypothetical protein